MHVECSHTHTQMYTKDDDFMMMCSVVFVMHGECCFSDNEDVEDRFVDDDGSFETMMIL